MKAFPTSQSERYPEIIQGGMDLRDYFAAKAMQGLLTRPIDELSEGQVDDHERLDSYISHLSYVMADAMMKARKNENN
jgi:prephenate dehydrogenase